MFNQFAKDFILRKNVSKWMRVMYTYSCLGHCVRKQNTYIVPLENGDTITGVLMRVSSVLSLE